MKLLNLILITLAISTTLHAQQLTIEQCHHMAEAHYPAIAQYELIEQAKHFDIRNANMAYLPQLSIGGQASWQSDVTKIDLDMPGIDIPIIDKDQYKVMAEISQLIWDGGMIGAKKKVTTADAEVQKQKLQTELYSLRERINNLFFGILLIDERLELHQLMEQELKRNYHKVQALIDNGVANQTDLSTVKVEMLKQKQERIELDASRQAFIKMLSIFIGKDISNGHQLAKPDINHFAFHANINRPELRLFDAQQQLIHSQRSVLNAKVMPTIGAFAQGGYGKPALNMFENKFMPYFIGGVKLSWNIGNLYTLANDRHKIEIQQSMLNSTRDTFLHNINILIPQQQIEIEKYRQTMQDDDEIISLRKQIREAADAKLDNGTITVSDVMREVTAEDAAKQTKVLHEIKYLLSIYNLKYITN